MNDSMRESLSYFGLYSKMLRVHKNISPESISFGNDKNQYFLYYEPQDCIHGLLYLRNNGLPILLELQILDKSS